MPLPLSLFPSIARAVDVSTRCDATAGSMVGERDYVAAFLATLRVTWRLLGGTAEIYSCTLPPRVEQLAGCDFAIVFQDNDIHKIVLVEAKWARLGWDSSRSTSQAARAQYQPHVAPPRISRFSDQIGRQAAWLAMHPSVFIAEMFLQIGDAAAVPYPYNDPACFDQIGSSFITHGRAREVIHDPVIAGTIQFPPSRLWHATGGAGPIEVHALTGHWLNADELFGNVIACRFGLVRRCDWRQLENEPREPGDLLSPNALMTALGLRQILVVHGQRPPQWG